jgi:hypothetical protein
LTSGRGAVKDFASIYGEVEMLYRHEKRCAIIFSALAFLLGNDGVANAQTRVSIGVTETIETANPYGDSVSLLYGIWSEITGPFCTYNYQKEISRSFSRTLES